MHLQSETDFGVTGQYTIIISRGRCTLNEAGKVPCCSKHDIPRTDPQGPTCRVCDYQCVRSHDCKRNWSSRKTELRAKHTAGGKTELWTGKINQLQTQQITIYLTTQRLC